MTEFNPNIQDVKNIIEGYTIDGQPAKCTNEQAQAVLDNWQDSLPDEFYEFVKCQYMENDEIFEIEES